MRRCIDWYLPKHQLQAVDLGSMDVNGSYRALFGPHVEYRGYDLEAGPGVDQVLASSYELPLAANSIDLVISGQMLEHCKQFWLIFKEVGRVLREGGLAFFIAPSSGPIHRYPVDCYRFYPDAFHAMAEWAGLRLIHCWMDNRGPWNDLVGVFQKGGDLVARKTPVVQPPFEPFNDCGADPNDEVTKGQDHYLNVLGRLHQAIKPSLYIEVGVRHGSSLKLCQCDMIGIDPAPDIRTDIAKLRLFPCTSDDFFFFYAGDHIDKKVDLAFIDGMHLVEYAYRDFINIEKFMSRTGVVVVDDVLPNTPLQASRKRQTRVWSGDVWRIVPLLAQERPDLRLTLLDVAPTGLLLISNLDPNSSALYQTYNPTVNALLTARPALPSSILTREFAMPPTDDILARAINR